MLHSHQLSGPQVLQTVEGTLQDLQKANSITQLLADLVGSLPPCRELVGRTVDESVAPVILLLVWSLDCLVVGVVAVLEVLKSSVFPSFLYNVSDCAVQLPSFPVLLSLLFEDYWFSIQSETQWGVQLTAEYKQVG